MFNLVNGLDSHGFDVFFPQSKDGKTPLHMTAIHGRFSRSQTIIHNGKKKHNSITYYLTIIIWNNFMY